MMNKPNLDLPDALLQLEFDGRTVRQNLIDALNRGELIQDEQGRLGFPADASTTPSNWLYATPIRNSLHSCEFLFKFMFNIVYAKSAVPQGCHDCYKVKACPSDFRGLLALRQISKSIPCNSKCGPEINHFYSQDLYGGFFYCSGLDHARAIYRQVRSAIDQDPALGPSVAMRIKRGCTPYEIHRGPSDRWTFHPAQVELEARLQALFISPRKEKTNTEFATLMRWVETAYSIGDDSYLEFTKGRRVYPATVSYAPAPPITETFASD